MGRFMGRWNQFTIVPTIPPTTPGRPMPYSMTAFARCDRNPWGSLAWELRSVNHRYLELALRLPGAARPGPAVRDTLSKRLARGKVDCNLRFQPRGATGGGLKVDERCSAGCWRSGGGPRLAAGAKRASVHGAWVTCCAGRACSRPRNPISGRWAKRPSGSFTRRSRNWWPRAGARRRLCELLRQRLDAMAAVAAQLRALLPELAETSARLHERLEELRAQLDAARLEQELVMALQKADVGEARPAGGAHRRGAPGARSGQAGRARLDFLMQELNREANTLGAKSADLRQTNASVDLKVLIEQLREQYAEPGVRFAAVRAPRPGGCNPRDPEEHAGTAPATDAPAHTTALRRV